MEQQNPSIGRIVHVVMQNNEDAELIHYPGIITRVNTDGTIDVTVFTPGGCINYKDLVKSQYEHKPNTWHFPERV